MFQEFPDKDCLLLRLRDGCSRPTIANGFRSLRADTHMSTIARMHRAADTLPADRKGSSLHIGGIHRKSHSTAATNGNSVVLYVFHRDELPFLNVGGVYFDGMDDEIIREATPVVVKGLGVRGIGRVVKVWSSKCWDGIKAIGHGGKSPSKGRSSMP